MNTDKGRKMSRQQGIRPGGLLILAAHLCGCTPLMEDGVYIGQTQKYGDVQFAILDGQFFGAFKIAAFSDCKIVTTNFSLRNVVLEDGTISTHMGEKDYFEVAGEIDHDNEFSGQYTIYPRFKSDTCTARGTWTAKIPGGKVEGNRSCLCRCTCTGSTIELTKHCPEGGCPSSCTSACLSACHSKGATPIGYEGSCQ